MAVSRRAITLATRGILTGAAISIATLGHIQLPTEVAVTPAVPTISGGARRIQRGPIEFVIPKKYELISEIQFMLRSLAYFDYEPTPLYAYNTRSHVVQILTGKASTDAAYNVESVSSFEVLLNANSFVEYSVPVSVTGNVSFILEIKGAGQLETATLVSGVPTLALNSDTVIDSSIVKEIYSTSALVLNVDSVVDNLITKEVSSSAEILLKSATDFESELKIITPQSIEIKSSDVWVLDSQVRVERELAQLGATEIESELEIELDSLIEIDSITAQTNIFNYSQNLDFTLRGEAETEYDPRFQNEDEIILALFAHAIIAIEED